MRIHWFGEPWPSADERAPVCEDDLYRVDTPAGESCLYCPDPIVVGDRGVVMGSTPDIPGGFSLRLNGYYVLAVATHVDCHLQAILGPELARASGITRRP